ncbi:unnamed protein product [Effrenium voratum]|uniref:EF-hand domain-containing protein n=1 Tax=Effrenium voratum TaxID=2562239 RepID=A0AA36MWC5_9DINO|nr:unnamed protein product [Effrenium voratum]
MHRYQQPQAPSRRPGRLPVAVKREAAEAKSTRLRVFTEAEKDEIGIATLLGEYTELGMNHGRPTFQKVENAGSEVNVFVYYWDTRDGPEFSGWWFGDKVGGTQVWSRAMDSGKAPPRKGWRVPWDGDEQQGLLLVEVMDTTAAMAQPVSASNGPRHASLLKQEPDPDQRVMAERVKLAMERIVAAEAEVEQAITSTKETLSGEELDESSLLETDSILRTQLDNVQSEQKHLAKELAEGRAAGGTQTSLGDLARLAPRVRQLAVSVGSQLTHVQAALTKVRQQAMLAKQKASAAEVAAEREQKDAASLQAILPEAMDIVTAAEDAVETVAILAAAVSVDETDTSETHKAKAIQDIEKCASKAQGDLLEAKKLVNGHMAACKKYAPEAQKVAIQEFAALEKRLNEAAKRLTPLKRFRQEHEQKAAARKALMEISQKLSSAELEIEKAHIMTSTDSQMEQDDITSTAQLLGPAEEDLKNAKLLIAKRLNATSKDDLEELHQRVADASAKLTTIRQVLARQEEALAVERALSEVHEKIEQAEEAYLATSEAEMPFLKGLEVLPIQEGMQAVAQCEAACERCEGALDVARKFLNKVETESKTKWSKEGQKHLAAELKKCRDRGEETHQKLRIFKKETRQRKAKAMLQEVSEKVAEAENQSQALAEVVKVLSAELDKVTVEALKLAIDQSIAAEKEAVRTYNAAREVMSAKQKEVKDPPLLMELTKLQKKLASAHQEMVKSRQIAKGGEQLIKDKKVVLEEERKVGLMETLVEKAEKMMPAEDQDVKKEELIQIDSAIKSANAAVHASQRSLDKHLAGDTSAKACLSKLVSRVKEAATKMEKIKKTTKTQREKASAEVIVKAAEQHVEAVEAALQKVAEAELPFLKGIEVIPLSEASSAIAECEQAAKQVQEALERAKSLIATKTIEAKKFAEVASKPCLERLALQVERINAAAAKLSQFRKDTESHKRTSQMHEAAEMLKKAEEEVEKTIEAGAPLDTEDLSITPEAATEVCAKLGHLEKAANKTVTEALVFLAERRKDVKGTPKEVELEKMQAQLIKIKAKLQTAKKNASQQEQRFVARKLAAEAAQRGEEVEEELKKVQAAAEPLQQSSGFLVQSNVQRLAAVVQELKAKDELKQAGKDMTLGAFRAFVARLAEEHNSEDSVFSEAEVEAMFHHLDADNSGDLSESEFQGIFAEQFACVQPISMTESFSITDGKSVAKLEVGSVVEALGMPQFDEHQKLTRLHCRLADDMKEGWVTMKGNQGKVFLDRLSPHNTSLKAFERMRQASCKVVGKALGYLNSTRKTLADCDRGPLVEARTKMDELRAKVVASQQKLDEIKKKVEEAAKEYSKREAAERQARSNARTRRLLDSISKEIDEKCENLRQEAKRIREVIDPLNSTADLEAVATPSSILRDGEQMSAKLADEMAAVRKFIEEHEAPKSAEGCATQIKQLLASAVSKLDALGKLNAQHMKVARSSALKVGQAALRKAQQAMRTEALRRELGVEALFDEMAGEGEVARSAMQRRLESLELSLSSEQVALLLDTIMESSSEDAVISRWRFLRNFQQFYECQKNIALTTDFVISNCKPKRSLNASEVVEVLEGPQRDEKLGIERIRGRAMRDNLEGWVSISGNQGTAFLKERPKPFVVCLIDLPLEKDFLSSGEPPIRLLKADEVLEHLEGPRSDTSEALMRARCKALSDDATGWITLTSQQQVTAEKGHQKFFSCKNGVAITDGPNIKACKAESHRWQRRSESCFQVFRKLEAGEVIRLLEGPEVDKDSGVTRIKAACLKDGLEGWVTTLGNAGTLYAEEQTQYYTVLCEAPLQKAKHSTSETVRALRRDEAIEVLEGPVEFTPEITERLKARAVNDGAMGWVTATTKRLKRWYPTYMCKQSTVLQDTLATKSANLVRRVEEGEVLEVLDGPKEDAEAGLLRVRAKARKDQAIGWITLRGNQGTLFLAQWTARDEQLAKQPKEQKEKEQKEEKEEKKVATSKV